MKNILITGANGYLGAQISAHLADAGHAVTAVCYPAIPDDAVWCAKMKQVLCGSVASDAFRAELADQSYDALIHLVSLDHHASQNASTTQALDVNVHPTWDLLDRFAKKGLKTFVFFSTIHVYGGQAEGLIQESQAVRPGNVYALTHALSETICSYYNDTTDVRCIQLRLSNSYGPPVFTENNCWWLAVNDLCRTAYQSRQIRLLSDGSPRRDFIHGSDVCRAVACLLDASDAIDLRQPFHIASGKSVRLLDLAYLIREVMNERYHEEIPIVCAPTSAGTTAMKQVEWDVSRMQALGFTVETDLKTGIHRMFDYFETHPIHANL